MSEICGFLPHKYPGRILCHYINTTSQIHITRITNIANWYFERVVFPGQRLLFEAPRLAKLEIHTGKLPTAILADKIPCSQLRITEIAS